MTTTVSVTAPGYEGKKVVVMTNNPNDGSGDWKTHRVLGPGESCTVVATDVQSVCVVEMTDEEYDEFTDLAADRDGDVETES